MRALPLVHSSLFNLPNHRPLASKPHAPYNKPITGVIGVDLDDVILSGEPRRRWPRKKRQKQQTRTLNRTRSQPKGCASAPLLPAERAAGVTHAGLLG